MATGHDFVWAPLPGSQWFFLTCPVYEALYEGTRGPGKTDTLLMDYAQHVGKGYGAHWRGVLFRRSYKALGELVTKSRRWFSRIFPQAKFYESAQEYRWSWPDGEELLFRHIKRESEYWDDYHGHEYPWIGWDELTSWPDLKLYHMLKSCNRSSRKEMPRRYRATANPYGPGHNHVKAYFIDPAPPGVEVTSEDGLKRVRIRGHWSENTILLEAEPDYPQKIMAAAANPEQAKAWLDGNWDIVAGGMLDDLWSPGVHIIRQPFDVPSSWRIDRAFDWGSAKPFSYGLWAESDGTVAMRPDGTSLFFPRGSLIRVHEWYGWDGKNPNTGMRMTDPDIGRGIVEREKQWSLYSRTRPGPADPSIFNKDAANKSIAAVLKAQGAEFVPGDNRAGSRKQGWAAIRRMLLASRENRPEEPGLWVMEHCRQWIRTVPTLPRSDRDLDDVDTEAEDHTGDETRYRVLAPRRTLTQQRFRVA